MNFVKYFRILFMVQIYFSMFIFRSFIDLGLFLWSISNYFLFMVWDRGWCSSFFLCWCPVAPALLKRLSISYWIALVPLLKINWPCKYEYIPELCSLIYLSFLRPGPYYGNYCSFTISLEVCSVSPSTLLFYKIVWLS